MERNICSQQAPLLHCVGMARQRLGQHFLHDSSWQQRILAALPNDPASAWVEIGAGHGEMTHLLAGRGARVVAIERDPLLVQRLREQIARNPAEWPVVEVVAADVLTCDFGKLSPGRFRVYGNLPYYITSPILHHLFEHADRIDSIHIVIQLEVAERLVARPGSREYGYLSVVTQFYGRPEIALRIPPGAFRPPPKVHSALVGMSLPGERVAIGVAAADEAAFLKFVQLCFQHKRRTLRNNLRAVKSDAEIHRALGDCGIRADARAEQLTLGQFAAIFARLR